jgi:Icc-related predicted phosphoesterase
MKILLTTDLHSCSFWYEWLIDQAGSVDLIALAGDLVEGFAPGSHSEEIRIVERCLGMIVSAGCPVAACSGNHELFLRKTIRVPEKPATTLSRLGELLYLPIPEATDHPLFVPDGCTRLVTQKEESLIITTIPYRIDVGVGIGRDIPEIHLWEEGRKLREERGCRWLVLHHEPPRHTRVGGMRGHFSLVSTIQRFQPDFVLSGHLHDQPFLPGGGFCDQIGKTFCFNPGQVHPRSSRTPNHIILNTSSGEGKWFHFWQENYRP